MTGLARAPRFAGVGTSPTLIGAVAFQQPLSLPFTVRPALAGTVEPCSRKRRRTNPASGPFGRIYS